MENNNMYDDGLEYYKYEESKQKKLKEKKEEEEKKIELRRMKNIPPNYKRKSSYTWDEIMEELIERLILSEDKYYKRILIQQKQLTKAQLKKIIEKEDCSYTKNIALEELERLNNIGRRRKIRKIPVNYFQMDIQGLSIGEEEYEELGGRERKLKEQEENKDKIKKIISSFINQKY
jgi:hypothetical protein